jgi:hypothetical protein
VAIVVDDHLLLDLLADGAADLGIEYRVLGS